MILTTDELVERFIKWANELQVTLKPTGFIDDSEIKAHFARRDTLEWAINNLKRIRDEIEGGK